MANTNRLNEIIVDAEARKATIKKTYKVNGTVHKNAVFEVHYPSIVDRIAISSIRAKLLDGAPVQSLDRLGDDLAFMLAYVQVTLVKAPSWFDLEHLDEIDVLRDLFHTIVEWVNSFRNEIEGTGHATDSSSTSDEENMESDEAIPSSN